MPQELHYQWIWDLHASPAALWPFAADTNRFNRDTGLPPVQKAGMGRLANARRNLRFRIYGVLIEWEEEPFEWIYPHRFGVIRHYRRGPTAEMRVRVALDPLPAGGTRLIYAVTARARNLLGRLAIPFQIGWVSARRFEAAFRAYDRQVSQSDNAALTVPSNHLAPGGRRRLANIEQRLAQNGFPSKLIGNLTSLVAQADDLTLERLRPYALADLWGQPRRQTLEFFLWATRLGLLEFRWDQLCPHCRQSAQSARSLREVAARQHCPSCNVDFTVNFDQTVELTFRPNPAIRPVAEGEKFCIAGPQTTPHVIAQQLLRPGEQRALPPGLAAGHYRLRLLESPGAQMVRVMPDGETQAIIRAGVPGWETQALTLSPAARLEFVNATLSEQLFILENTSWNEQATPAADVTALQTFCDLFASEALRPGEPISVGSLAIVFTDLRGSTRLYREIGDAPAFGSVMEHFDVLQAAVSANGGAVVKTMGDAVMAVFRRPVAALQAMLSAQSHLAAPLAGERPLYLKAAILYGPCIAVNANGRLDYFGTSVNLTARLVELSNGEDVILDESVVDDPEVKAMLAAGFSLEPFSAQLKGFEQEHHKFWRVRER